MQTTTVGRGIGATLRRNPAAPLRHLDWVLASATFAIVGLGCLMVFSATRVGMADAGLDPYTYLKRQVLFVVLGTVVMAGVMVVDYRTFRDLAPLGHLTSLGLLVLVLTPLGTTVNGAQSWFSLGAFKLQPAEFTKLALIVVLAAVCAPARSHLDRHRLGICLALLGLPAALVLLQPDMGSMLVLVAIFLAVVVVAGARPRALFGLAAVGIIAVVAMFQLDMVDAYQRDRLTEFAREGNGGVTGAGFQASQAKTAIGAGGLFGAGLYDGTQTKLGFVPEQQTDFIFTVVGEELGFVGSATLLALYAVVVWRVWRSAQVARDLFGTLVCVGVMGMLVFQIFQNLGMSMGIMPITGLPLPLLSYGGSSLVTSLAAIGLVLNVHMRRFS